MQHVGSGPRQQFAEVVIGHAAVAGSHHLRERPVGIADGYQLRSGEGVDRGEVLVAIRPAPTMAARVRVEVGMTLLSGVRGNPARLLRGSTASRWTPSSNLGGGPVQLSWRGFLFGVPTQRARGLFVT
jgi:hypothetical protein